jgi:hypothetical protein
VTHEERQASATPPKVRLGRRLMRAVAILATPVVTAAAVVTFPATAEAVSPAPSTPAAQHTVASSRLPLS